MNQGIRNRHSLFAFSKNWWKAKSSVTSRNWHENYKNFEKSKQDLLLVIVLTEERTAELTGATATFGPKSKNIFFSLNYFIIDISD